MSLPIFIEEELIQEELLPLLLSSLLFRVLLNVESFTISDLLSRLEWADQ